jgi:hypothetical protein
VEARFFAVAAQISMAHPAFWDAGRLQCRRGDVERLSVKGKSQQTLRTLFSLAFIFLLSLLAGMASFYLARRPLR